VHYFKKVLRLNYNQIITLDTTLFEIRSTLLFFLKECLKNQVSEFILYNICYI